MAIEAHSPILRPPAGVQKCSKGTFGLRTFSYKMFSISSLNEFLHLTAQRKMKKVVVILRSLCMFPSFFSYIPRGKRKLNPSKGNNVIHQAMKNHPTMNVVKYMFRKYFQI